MSEIEALGPNALRVVPIGGLGRVGGNMMVYETAQDLIVVDCGVNFSGPLEPGVDWLIPKCDYLKANIDKLRGYIITHGHEDHVGAVPYVVPHAPAPIYVGSFTRRIAEHKIAEHGLSGDSRIKLRDMPDFEPITLGTLTVTPLPVTHSIPGAVLLGIDTPAGRIVHTADFKIDPTPLDDRAFAADAIEAFAGDEGVEVLLSDSTNAEKPGHTRSEAEVGEGLDELIGQAPARVLVTTFSSNIFRLKSILAAATKHGRKVIIVGRSMRNFVQMAREEGLLQIDSEAIHPEERATTLARQKTLILAAGCQADVRSAFGRIARGEHGQIRLAPGDQVIMSSRRIPGNEFQIGEAYNSLHRQGITVLDDRHGVVHTSGHGYQEEHQAMLRLCRPRHFIPLHGEVRHMAAHAKTAEAMGAIAHLLESGARIEFERQQSGVVSSKGIPNIAGEPDYLDGTAYVPDIVLRDRMILNEVGFVAAVVHVDRQGLCTRPPVIITRGVVWVDGEPELLEHAAEAIESALMDLDSNAEQEERLEAVRLAMRRFFKRRLGRRPLLVPVVQLDDEDAS